MLKLSYVPDRYPYGNCVLNASVFYAKQFHLRYEAAFQNTWGFNYRTEQGIVKFFGNQETVRADLFEKNLGLKRSVLFKSHFDEARVVKYMERLLADDLPPVMIVDGFYDPSTKHGGVFQNFHDRGHGRFVTGLDRTARQIYYVATDPTDPPGEFLMSFTDLAKALKSIYHFEQSGGPMRKSRVSASLRKILSSRYYRTVFDKMSRYADWLPAEPHHDGYYSTVLKSHAVEAALVSRCRTRFKEHILYLFEDAPDAGISEWIDDFAKVIAEWSSIEGLFLRQSVSRDDSCLAKAAEKMKEISREEKALHARLLKILKTKKDCEHEKCITC